VSSIVIATVTAARQIPAERDSRTIFPLLAKPISRWQVLVGKFLGCWAACVLSLTVFYAFFIVLSGTREQFWPLANCLQAYWLHCLFCAVVVAMTLLGSVVYTAASANVTITVSLIVAILLLGRHLHKVAVRVGGVAGRLLEAAYFAIPHLEWFDVRDLIIHNWPPLAGSVIVLDTVYAALFSGVFLMLAWFRFRRMALN
jgi:ABC-type transport system involved in multi-copper enzyme maturation permease subunit